MRFPLKHLTRNTFALMGQSPFVRSVGVLLTGGGIAQLLSLLLLPVLTSIYSPEDFDVLAVFAGVSIISYRCACLAFDFAIPSAESDEEAINLLAAALLSLAGTTALSAILTAACLNVLWAVGWHDPRYDVFVWLVPAATLLMGAASAFDYWTTRMQRFGLMSAARIAQVLVGGGFQVALGLAGAGTNGILIGYVLLYSGSLVLLGGSFARRDLPLVGLVAWHRLRSVAAKFNRFPRFTAAEVFANSFSVYFPLIIISAVAIGPEAGFLFLAIRLTQGPMQMLTGVIAQVFHSHALAASQSGRIGSDTGRLLRTMIGTATGPLIALVIVAPEVIALALEPEWRPTGTYIIMLLPAVYLHFLSASVITTMHTLGRNAELLVLTVFGAVLRVGGVALCAFVAVELIEETYALTGALFYGLCLATFMRASGVRWTELAPRNPMIYLLSAGLVAFALFIKLMLESAAG